MAGATEVRILLTGAGGPATIGVARSLRMPRGWKDKHYLVGTDRDRFALQHAATDTKHVSPDSKSAEYIPFLNDLIEAEGIDFVHAQPDPEVRVISENRWQIRARTFLPSRETVRVCQDKYATFKVLARSGIPVPQSYALPDEVRLNQVWDLLMPGVGKMWLRANTGAAGRGAYLIQGHGKYDQARMWIDSQNGWGEFMAAEYLPGRCVTWQSLWKDGNLVAAQGRERLEWHLANRSPSGVTGITGVGRTVSRKDMDEIGRAAVLAVEATPNGIFGVDMKENARGVPCVTEINIGRFFTTIEFFAHLGLNFPEMYVRCGMGERVDPTGNVPEGWLWIRSMDSLPRLVHESQLCG